MARPRIRTIKPEVWQDDNFGNVNFESRLLFLGLVTQADDDGRLVGAPSLIRSQIFPFDSRLTLTRVKSWLEELQKAGLIVLYEHNKNPYIALPKWGNHQKINRPRPSKLPPPPVMEFTERSVKGS